MKNVPNYFTLGNLLCGSIATLAVASGGYGHWAALLIFLGAFLDLFDGAIARKVGASGPMGRELDSLADVVTFGLAPAAIAFSLLTDGIPFDAALAGISDFTTALPLLSFLLVFGAAWRLARFNIDDTQSTSFRGMPSPANGLFWASVSAVSIESAFLPSAPVIVVGIILLSWLMVSPVRMISFKFSHSGWKGNEWRYVYIASLLPVAIIAWLATGALSSAVTVLLFLYLILSLVSHLIHSRTHENISR